MWSIRFLWIVLNITLFKVLLDIVDLNQFLTLLNTLKVLSAVAELMGTVVYNVRSLWTSGRHSFDAGFALSASNRVDRLDTGASTLFSDFWYIFTCTWSSLSSSSKTFKSRMLEYTFRLGGKLWAGSCSQHLSKCAQCIWELPCRFVQIWLSLPLHKHQQLHSSREQVLAFD